MAQPVSAPEQAPRKPGSHAPHAVGASRPAAPGTAHQIEVHAVNARDRVPGRSIIAGRSAHDESADASRLTLTYQPKNPTTGELLEQKYSCATDAQIGFACERAWEAWHAIRDLPAETARAALLECVASKIALLADELPELASKETGFGVARMRAERDNTLSNLRWLAGEVRSGTWHNAIIESQDYDRRPIPKPDQRSMLRSIGPVMALGPGSQPIVLGSAGFDTASAIAAGCPVVFKAHPCHPGTDELMGWAVASAIEELDLHPGTFSMLHAGGRDRDVVAHTILQNACIRGVVGSCSFETADVLEAFAHKRADGTRLLLTAGTANPVVVLPNALANDTERITRNVSEAVLLAGGQSCHKPSVVIGIISDGFESLTYQMADKLSDAEQHVVFSECVRDRYNAQLQGFSALERVEFRSGKAKKNDDNTDRKAGQPARPVAVSPAVIRTDAKTFLRHSQMYSELFGPAIILVHAFNETELVHTIASFQGALNITIWAQPADGALARRIMPVIEQRTSRIVLNASTIHVEDSPALVVGGPSPAQMEGHQGWSARGRNAIARFTRPVCYEQVWENLLPQELHLSNPLRVVQQIDGTLEAPAKTPSTARSA